MSQKKNKQTKDPYIKVPLWLTKMTSNKKSAIYLTPFQLNLYCLIRGLCDKKPCYAKDKYFSETFNVSITHINKTLNKLQSKGFINRETESNRHIVLKNKLEKGYMSIVYDDEDQIINITTENNVYIFNWDEWSSLVFEDGNNYDPFFPLNLK